VFETFGPVACPLYSVRFNSEQHIAEHHVEVGAKVYFVPNASEWTHYVFLKHVRMYVYVVHVKLTSRKQHFYSSNSILDTEAFGGIQTRAL